MTTTTPVRSDVVATARELRPQIESYSEEAERIRRMPDGLVRILSDNRFFGMARPPELGGLGIDELTAMRAIEEISVADASAGWVAAIGSGVIGSLNLADDVARKIYQPGSSVCGVGAPTGRAAPVDGGFRISGRWAYASGVHNSDWIFLGNVVVDGDKPRITASGQPEFRMTIVPVAELEIIDSWHVSGLRGTGSNDVAASDLFVPNDHTVLVSLGTSAASTNGDYRIPMFTLFGLALTPVSFGAARRAIDELLAVAQGKTPMLSAAKLREKPVVQHEIARAEGMLQAARAYLYAVTAELLDRVARRQEIDVEMRARVRLALTHGTDAAAQATQIAYRLGGASANYEDSVLQRCVRDVNAVTQHFMVSSSNYETVGRVLMGLDPGTPIL